MKFELKNNKVILELTDKEAKGIILNIESMETKIDTFAKRKILLPLILKRLKINLDKAVNSKIEKLDDIKEKDQFY